MNLGESPRAKTSWALEPPVVEMPSLDARIRLRQRILGVPRGTFKRSRRTTQRAITGIVMACRTMRFNQNPLRHALQGMASVPFWPHVGISPTRRSDVGPGLFNPSANGGLSEPRPLFASRPCRSATIPVSAPTRAHNSPIKPSFSAALRQVRPHTGAMAAIIRFRAACSGKLCATVSATSASYLRSDQD